MTSQSTTPSQKSTISSRAFRCIYAWSASFVEWERRKSHRDPNLFLTLARNLGLIPPLEERGSVCDHCGSGVTEGYIVWYINRKYAVPDIFLISLTRVTRESALGLGIKRSRTRTTCRSGLSLPGCLSLVAITIPRATLKLV